MFRVVLVGLVCSSCFLSVKKTPIERPEIDRDFYLNSIEALEDAIQEQPDYTPFIELQLSYYEQLGWPKSAGDAIARANTYLSTDQKFFAQKIAYYRTNQLYDELIKALERYPIEGELPIALQVDFTEALINTRDTIQAVFMLKRLESKQDSSLVQFVFDGYQAMNDTSGMLSMYERNKTLFSDIQIKEYVVPLYLASDQYENIIFLSKEDPSLFESPPGNLQLAKSYVGIDSLRIAEIILRNDTTWEGQWLLTDIYINQYKYVSATRTVLNLMTLFPERVEPLKKLAQIENVRGYYEEAIQSYQKVLKIDSTDEEASLEIAQINKKIAYLRLQKEQNQVVPILGIDSLKKDINQ